MGPIQGIEKALAGVYKGAPALPKGAKDWLVKYLPWLVVIAAAGCAWGSYALWHWAHVYNVWVDYLNAWSSYYGGSTVAASRMSVGLWIAFIVILVEAVIYLLAFPGLKAVKKAGWNLLFLGTLVNLVYGIVAVFTDYNGVGNLIGAIIGSIIAWYFLFQIRDRYSGGKVEATKPAEPPKA